jgi:hypothetical protein
MRILEKIKDDEMIAEFLKAEINSDRWSLPILYLLQRSNINRSFIDNPNVQNDKDNRLRKKNLAEFRGYGENKFLFQSFPSNVQWKRVLLTKEELGKVLYIDWDYWSEVTKGTRLPGVLVERIITGEVADTKETLRIKKVADLIKNGELFPKLILVDENEKARLVALEGNLRLTEMILAQKNIPDEIEVIVGFSDDMPQWANY